MIHIHSLEIAKNMSKQDVMILRKYNRFDLGLFRLAQWIANADVEFKNQTRSL